MSRFIDLFAVVAVAVVILLPKASVEARPALEGGEAVELDRVSKLQDDAFRNPNDVNAAVALGDAFLSFFRADWTISTMQPFVEREQKGQKKDARVHLLLATARAERLEAAQAVDEAKLADAACSAGEGVPECPAGTLARARLIQNAMQALLDEKIDPAKEPQKAKDAVYKVLHPGRSDFAPRTPAK